MRKSDVRTPRALALSDKVVHLLKASEDTTEEEEEEEVVVVVAADACAKCPHKDGKTKKTERMTGDQNITEGWTKN